MHPTAWPWMGQTKEMLPQGGEDILVVRKGNWGRRRPTALVFPVFLLAALAWAQTPSNQPQTTQKQDIPDAPSAVRPPQPFPTPPPTGSEETAPSSSSNPAQGSPAAGPPTEETPPEPAPLPKITTVPPGGATPSKDNSGDDLYKIVVRTNQVLVPVRVTDDSGHMVDGLISRDFSVYEDGR